MLRCKEMFSAFALVAPFVLGGLGGLGTVAVSMSPSSAIAGSQAPDLCIATGIDTGNGRGGCVYAGPNAPVFDDEVCWDGEIATVKGTAPCLPGAFPYYLRNGEVVDPNLGLVVGYASVPTACLFMSCAPTTIESQGLADELACCTAGGCTQSVGGTCPEGEPTWCTQLEVTDDGLVCHQD